VKKNQNSVGASERPSKELASGDRFRTVSPRSSGRSFAWDPLLEGDLGEHARQAVQAIARALRIRPRPATPGNKAVSAEQEAVEQACLARGRAGLAVLFSYLAQAGPDGGAAEKALCFLNEAVEAVATLPMAPGLYQGFIGIGWAAEHVNGLLTTAEDDPNEAADAALLEHLNQSHWRYDYDLINGLVGLGVYALERLPRPTAVTSLERVIDRLAESAERRADGITWHTPAELLISEERLRYPAGYYNLGVAHGVPGVIALLGAACAAGVAAAKARPLLRGAVAWLVRQQLPAGAGSRFPSLLAPGIEPAACRLAWCYGDAGVAVALLSAARGLGEPAWEQEALAIARAAAARQDNTAGVLDAGLCHGAAGLGHLFNRLFHAAGDPCFAEAARFWFRRCLEMRQPGRGVAGFSRYWQRQDGADCWLKDPGLLTGAAGIALALLAAATPIEPAWDRMLLVAIPPAAEV
jgi:lantibiotic modifying enzyme